MTPPTRLDRTHAVQLRPRTFSLRYWRALRRNFRRRDCLRIMWYGGEMAIEYEEEETVRAPTVWDQFSD